MRQQPYPLPTTPPEFGVGVGTQLINSSHTPSSSCRTIPSSNLSPVVEGSEEGVGLRADAEAPSTVIDQLNNGQLLVEIPGPQQDHRSPRPAAPSCVPLIPTRHALADARARQPMRPGRGSCSQASAPAGARDWQPPASAGAHPPTRGEVLSPPALGHRLLLCVGLAGPDPRLSPSSRE